MPVTTVTIQKSFHRRASDGRDAPRASKAAKGSRELAKPSGDSQLLDSVSLCNLLLGVNPPPLTLQKQLHRRQHHLLLQERDLLLGVGIVNSAARQRLASAEQKQALQDLLAGCNQATGITCVAVHCGQGQSEQLADAGAGWSSE